MRARDREEGGVIASNLAPRARELLQAVKKRYLDSRDFNGYHLRPREAAPNDVDAAVELCEAGLIHVMSGVDYMNIHIRPWPPRLSQAEQAQEIRDLQRDDYGVCLYPTSLAMQRSRLPKRFEDAPFATAMARGKGTLEVAYFTPDVLEAYRNDARFRFDMGDFGISFGLTDEAYDVEPEHDRVGLIHLGFAYDLREYELGHVDAPIARRVAAFYGDLDDLTPAHQQRWASFQISADGIEPHPIWFAAQMGQWADGVGPFARFQRELETIGLLYASVWGIKLFRSAEPPDDFGWILRADQREWDHFVHSLDKMLSESIDHSALDRAGVERMDASGHRMGSVARLERFMTNNHVASDKAKWAVEPIRRVRAARQKPAHALRNNLSDRTLVRKQMQLMRDVNEVLINIRQWLASHPKNAGWNDDWEGLRDYPL